MYLQQPSSVLYAQPAPMNPYQAYNPLSRSNFVLQHINCILPASANSGGLYIGDTIATLKQELLVENNIQAILCCNLQASKMVHNIRFPVDFKYLELTDHVSFAIKDYFETAYEFIQSKLAGRKNVLVQCHGGVSRSATVICAYFIKKNGWSPEEALRFLKQKRPRVRPNQGFQRQLQQYWQEIKQNKKYTTQSSFFTPQKNREAISPTKSLPQNNYLQKFNYDLTNRNPNTRISENIHTYTSTLPAANNSTNNLSAISSPISQKLQYKMPTFLVGREPNQISVEKKSPVVFNHVAVEKGKNYSYTPEKERLYYTDKKVMPMQDNVINKSQFYSGKKQTAKQETPIKNQHQQQQTKRQQQFHTPIKNNYTPPQQKITPPEPPSVPQPHIINPQTTNPPKFQPIPIPQPQPQTQPTQNPPTFSSPPKPPKMNTSMSTSLNFPSSSTSNLSNVVYMGNREQMPFQAITQTSSVVAGESKVQKKDSNEKQLPIIFSPNNKPGKYVASAQKYRQKVSYVPVGANSPPVPANYPKKNNSSFHERSSLPIGSSSPFQSNHEIQTLLKSKHPIAQQETVSRYHRTQSNKNNQNSLNSYSQSYAHNANSGQGNVLAYSVVNPPNAGYQNAFVNTNSVNAFAGNAYGVGHVNNVMAQSKVHNNHSHDMQASIYYNNHGSGNVAGSHQAVHHNYGYYLPNNPNPPTNKQPQIYARSQVQLPQYMSPQHPKPAFTPQHDQPYPKPTPAPNLAPLPLSQSPKVPKSVPSPSPYPYPQPYDNAYMPQAKTNPISSLNNTNSSSGVGGMGGVGGVGAFFGIGGQRDDGQSEGCRTF